MARRTSSDGTESPRRTRIKGEGISAAGQTTRAFMSMQNPGSDAVQGASGIEDSAQYASIVVRGSTPPCGPDRFAFCVRQGTHANQPVKARHNFGGQMTAEALHGAGGRTTGRRWPRAAIMLSLVTGADHRRIALHRRASRYAGAPLSSGNGDVGHSATLAQSNKKARNSVPADARRRNFPDQCEP
jgi:hypothetical protein